MIRDVVRWQPPERWGVLCIDTWHVNGINDQFYQTALEKLSEYNVEAVVNCTMDLHLDYQDKSVYNTLSQYLWTPTEVYEEQKKRVLLDLVTSAGHQKTSHILQEKLFGPTTVHLSSRYTFIQHCQTFFPTVKDWIMLGSAWGMCFHRGPLGVDVVVDIGEMKFNMFPEWSVQTENRTPPTLQQIHDDFYVWAPIPNGGYKLITRANNHKWFDNKTT